MRIMSSAEYTFLGKHSILPCLFESVFTQQRTSWGNSGDLSSKSMAWVDFRNLKIKGPDEIPLRWSFLF